MKYLKLFEEISKEMLQRAADQASKRGQHSRKIFKDKLGEIESAEREAFKNDTINYFNTTFPNFLGGEIGSLRIKRGGDTWIEIKNPTCKISGMGHPTKIFITCRGNNQGLEYSARFDSGDPKPIDEKDIIFDNRGQAVKYNRFKEWWLEKEIPFNLDNYKIMGIHN